MRDRYSILYEQDGRLVMRLFNSVKTLKGILNELTEIDVKADGTPPHIKTLCIEHNAGNKIIKSLKFN